MGLVFIFLLWPLVAAIAFAYIAAVVVVLLFIGACLLAIGISGASMNKIYKWQTKDEKGTVGRFFTTSSVFAGVVVGLVPVGIGLYIVLTIVAG